MNNIKILQNASDDELNSIKEYVSEAFVPNELFHEWGDVSERRELVKTYMSIYVDYAYESQALYVSENHKACIGLLPSNRTPIKPQIKMLIRIMRKIPFGKIKRLMGFVKEISGSDKEYASKPHIEVLMVCVDRRIQGTGCARELIEFAQGMSKNKQLPILIGTDMESYAEMYIHLGCRLFNETHASNGVTRYNLIWEP